MLNWESFSEKLGTWAYKIKPFFDAGGFEPIYNFLKEESKAGKKITPDSKDTFRCFRETPLPPLKCVMMGLCPYHSEHHGKLVADGLLMGCSRTGRRSCMYDR